MKLRRIVIRLAVVASILLSSLIATVPAFGTNGITCDSGFGAKVPVLMVHGFNSNPEMWSKTDSSMSDAMAKIGGISIVDAFDYEDQHFNWVTDPNIGPKLADTIHCLAQNSRKGGGAGKVIVVAHSMGGLAVREAATWAIDGRKIADEIGLVITLATPNIGSSWGNAGTSVVTTLCQLGVAVAMRDPLLGINMTSEQCMANMALKGLAKDSKELQQLPPLPRSIPVRAIAGNVNARLQLLFTSLTVSTKSDLVVGTDSATAESTNTGHGDGRFVFGCFTDIRLQWKLLNPIDVTINQGNCWHNGIYTAAYAQQTVVNGIQEYLATTNRPKAPPAPVPARSSSPTPHPTQPPFELTANTANLSPDAVTLFNRLTIHLGRTWNGVMSEPDVYVAYADQTICNDVTAACPHIFFVDLTSPKASGSYAPDPLKRWSTDPSGCEPELVQGPVTAMIGGRSAKLYRQGCVNDKYAAPRYAWLIPGQLFVAINRVGGEGAIVQGALQTATWQQ